METNAKLLDLAKPRVVCLVDRGVTYTYHFRRINADDWKKYFEAKYESAVNEPKGQRRTLDFDSGGSQLVRSTVDRVEGYAGTFTERPDWRDLLPARHTKSIALLLQHGSVVPRPVAIDPLSCEVEIAVVWTMTEAGKMGLSTGLVHRFSPPNAEQQRKVNRAMSECRVIGGSRRNMTVYPATQPTLMAMYDELVQSVEGYAFNGEPLAGLDQIRREMDAAHKVISVRDLFAEPDSDVVDEEGVEAQ